MVRKALWDRWTAAAFLHPSHDAPRSLFARAKPAPGDKAGLPNYLKYQCFMAQLIEQRTISRRSWVQWIRVEIVFRLKRAIYC